MRRRKHEQNRRTDRKNCPDGEGHKKLEDIATIQREGNLQKKDLVDEGIRWTLTIAATIINALGVAFITTAALGTVPATAIPNVLAIVQDRFTLGQYLFALSVLQLVLQVVLLKKDFRPIQITQMIPAVLLSYFVDFFMKILVVLPLDNYVLKMIWLLVGTVILSFAIALEVKVDLVYLPLDALNKAIAFKSGKSFELIKTLIDCGMVLIALLIILPIRHGLYGVREGTIIAALISGYIVKLFSKMLNKK